MARLPLERSPNAQQGRCWGEDEPLNFALNSPGAVQTTTLTAEQVDQVRKLATTLDQMKSIPGIPEKRHDEVEQVIADLEGEVSASEPRQSRLRIFCTRRWNTLHWVLPKVPGGNYLDGAVSYRRKRQKTRNTGIGL